MKAVRAVITASWIAVLASGCVPLTSPTVDPRPPISTLPAHSTPEPSQPFIPPSLTVPLSESATPFLRLSQSAEVISRLPNVTLDVELFYDERWMRVWQTVELENTSPDPWDEVVFNVPINVVLDAFYLDRVAVTMGGTVQEGTPSLFGSEAILRVPLPRSAMPGETVHVEMGYRVVIPPLAPTDWPPVGTTGWREGLIQAGEWYPALVPYIDGEGWYTWEYRPVGDPTVYPLVNTNLNVATEEGVIIASGGPQGDGADNIWHFSVPAGRGIAFMASDVYRSVEGEANGIPITSFYLPFHADAGHAALEMAEQSVELWEELYGPYPYTSLTVTENGYFGAMEYSALITITDYAYTTYYGQSPSLLAALVAHETAHQWWYGAVGNDQPHEPWLDEALAFYSELLYFERYYPGSADWWWERRVNVYNPHGPVDATIYSYDESSAFITSVYGQSARFIRDLRDLMGDQAFFTFLRDYYATYSGGFATGADFKRMAMAYSDADLTSLFESYFAQPQP